MTPEEASAAITAAFAEVHATIARTDDPAERQLALLRCYGESAQIQAALFVHDLVLPEPSRVKDNLDAVGQRAVDDMLEIFLRVNAERGLDFEEFTDATKKVVTLAFFSRLNELLAVAIVAPEGTA